MRYFTIILAVLFGMMLSWVMLLNPQIVQVRLDSVGADGLSWLEEPVRAMAMWKVIFWSVALGIAIGVLLMWSSGAESRRRLRDFEYSRDSAAADDDEPDYVVGLTGRRR